MITGAIILAAGASSRMGQPKQLLDVHGKPLLQLAIDACTGTGLAPIAVIVGHNHPPLQEVMKGKPVHVVVNDAWEKGMGSSIKTGLRYLLQQNPNLDNVIIAVCDQPYLDSKVITALVQEHARKLKPITASVYAGAPGVPVVFQKSYFKKLMLIGDDEGAKKLLRQNPSDVAVVEFAHGEVDLDTMDDYLNFISENRRET